MGIVVKNSPYVLGIDFGTSTSSVALFQRGTPTVLKIAGQKLIPSVVHVRSDGRIMVGQQAKSKILIDPANTVASIKREFGTDSYEKTFPGLPERTFSACDIASEIFRAIREALNELNDPDLRGSPKYAVVCVPANFDDVKKNVTRQAAEMAGFEVLYLLEEPVAAALAYGFDKERDQTVLIYDLGGGTFDVSILEVDTASPGAAGFRVRAKEGIPLLGGDDFDAKIMEMLNEHLREDGGVDVLDLKKDQGISTRRLREAQQKLKEAAETAKKELTTAESFTVEIPHLVQDESKTVHHIEKEILRADFEEAVRPLVFQSKSAVEKALNAAGMTIEDISRIVLVGGSTRVPIIRQMLVEMFGKEPYTDMDPDVLVAMGAAIYGASLGVPSERVEETAEPSPEDRIDKTFILDNKVTHHLGIEVYGRRFSPLIEKDTVLPHDNPTVKVNKTYTTPRDNAAEIAINVYQATDRVDYVSDERAVCVGELFLTGIPPAPAGSEKITVSFEIDGQNLLKVQASSVSEEGSTKSLEIRRS